MSAHGEDNSWAGQLERWVARWIALPTLGLLVIAACIVIADTVTGDVDGAPPFLDSVFASPIVLAAARVAVLFASGYVVASVVSLASRRAWLTRIGPAETSASVEQLSKERDELAHELDDAKQTISRLARHLDETTDKLEKSAE